MSSGIAAGGIRTRLRTAKADGALSRSNSHLHHRRAERHCCTSAIGMGTLGNRRKRNYDNRHAGSALSLTGARDAPVLPDGSTVRSIEGGFFTACGARYPKSSPPAFVVPRLRQTKLKTNSVAALSLKRRKREPFLVRSAIGIRLAPRSLRQAPRFGRARACASPGIRVSRSGFCRRNTTSCAPEIQNPPELTGSGGSV
jgi:hypothetical protein